MPLRDGLRPQLGTWLQPSAPPAPGEEEEEEEEEGAQVEVKIFRLGKSRERHVNMADPGGFLKDLRLKKKSEGRCPRRRFHRAKGLTLCRYQEFHLSVEEAGEMDA